MAVFEGSFRSQALGMDTGLSLCLPQDTASYNPETMGTLILLHGLHGNHTGWFRKTSVERYASAHNLAVICPDGNNSMYADTTYGADYFKYITAELPEFAAKMFHLPIDRDHLYIAGLSMGGYGALKCALTYPERYAGCGSFSGVTDLVRYRNAPAVSLREREFTALLGMDRVVQEENDLMALARKAEKLPPIYLSCGEQDRHYEANCAFAQLLTDLGITHRYDHREGNHSWAFWDRSIQDCFDYLKL